MINWFSLRRGGQALKRHDPFAGQAGTRRRFIAFAILVLLILCGCGAPTVQNAAVTEAQGTSISEDNTPHMGRY